jgi:hypothetical protein
VKRKQPKTDYLKITDLVIDPRLQMRAKGLNEEHVNDLVEAIKQGKELPKVQVRRIKDRGDFVTDGFHTLEAHGVAGFTKVAVDIKHGSWEDAVLDAALANQEHLGLKRSNKDKRRAVEMLLSVRPNWSGAKIAQELGVSDSLVNDVRKEQSNNDELTDSVSSSSSEEKIIGVNGKHYGPKHQAPRRPRTSDVAMSEDEVQGRTPLESLDGDSLSRESLKRSMENGKTVEVPPGVLSNFVAQAGGISRNGDHTPHIQPATSPTQNNGKTRLWELTAQQLDDPEILAAEFKLALLKIKDIQKTISACFRSPLKQHVIDAQSALGLEWYDSGEVYREGKSINTTILRKYDCKPLDIISRFLASVLQRLEGRGPKPASDASPWDVTAPEMKPGEKP